MWVLEASGAGKGHIHLQTRTFCPVLSSVSQKPQMIVYIFSENPDPQRMTTTSNATWWNPTWKLKKKKQMNKQNKTFSPAQLCGHNYTMPFITWSLLTFFFPSGFQRITAHCLKSCFGNKIKIINVWTSRITQDCVFISFVIVNIVPKCPESFFSWRHNPQISFRLTKYKSRFQ